MGAKSFLYLQTFDFALGRKPIGEFVAWCKAALLGPVVSGSGNLCFAQRRRDCLRQWRWRCADILEGRIPDGLSGGGPPGGRGMTGCLTCHDDDSLVITFGTSSAEPHRQQVATTGLPGCRMVPAGLRGPRDNRTSNGGRRMEFHAGAQAIESPSEARRSAPHRSSEDRSDRGLAGGALRNHAWPIDSREAKESRTVVTCRLATTLCPAFPVVG